MAAIVEVKYFNSFVLKKTVNSSNEPIWNGSTGVPFGANGGYPVLSVGIQTDKSWLIEESRIRGGYNTTSVDYGVRAYITEENSKAKHRVNSLIYSGVFNSRTGFNESNVFSVADDITKSADPANGSIQKLYAEDTNLIIFQENKVSRALIDKDAIYSAEGGGSVTSARLVVGQIVPYAGNFGISKNPESFAVYGYRKYFVDANRNAVMRLSQDGMTEISNYGMIDYFRDNLGALNGGKAIGAWDIYTKQYVVSLQGSNVTPTIIGNYRGSWVFGQGYVKNDSVTYLGDDYICISNITPSSTPPDEDTDNWSIYTSLYQTLSFDESVKGWTSRFTYDPDQAFSIKNKYYSIKNKKLYQHNLETQSSRYNRGAFYGKYYRSTITFVFNPSVSVSKVFKTVNYEGSTGWEVSSFQAQREFDITDSSKRVYSFDEGSYTQNGIKYYAGFHNKEGKYKANLVNNSNVKPGEIIFGGDVSGVKGYYATVTINTDDSTQVTGQGGKTRELFAVSSDYVESSY